MNKQPTPTSSRLLTDIPCKVCSDHSSGKHYGIYACDGCAGFFKRSVRRGRRYECKSRMPSGTWTVECAVDKTHRNQCRACRLAKCLQAGMNKEAVQHERGPRHSTLRRQMTVSTTDNASLKLLPTGHVHSPTFYMRSPTLSRLVNGGECCNASETIYPLAAILPHLPQSKQMAPAYTGSVEVLCEAAARLLFMSVKWAKNVPAFAALPLDDQTLLLADSWRELFLLSASQFQMPLHSLPALSSRAMSINTPTSLSHPELVELHALEEVITRFKVMQVDTTEYACMKGIVLFKTALPATDRGCLAERKLQEVQTVAVLQDQTQLTLSKYIEVAYPTQPFRFGKLLLMLPALRVVSSRTIENLFFRSVIGDIPMERLIINMYKSEDV